MAIFSHQHVREFYLAHTFSTIGLFLALIILLYVPKVDSNDDAFVYPWEVLLNVMPTIFSATALLILQTVVSGPFLLVVEISNAFAFMGNLIVLVIFSVVDSNCGNKDSISQLCNLPDNMYVRRGYEVIMSLFVLSNIFLFICTRFHRKFNTLALADRKKITANPDQAFTASGRRFLQLTHHYISIAQMTDIILALELIVLTPYSKCALLFLFHVPLFVPAIVGWVASSRMDQKNSLVGIATSACCFVLSGIGFVMSALYLYKTCSVGSNPFIDNTCYIGYKSALGYFILHIFFFALSFLRSGAFGISLMLRMSADRVSSVGSKMRPWSS